MVAALVLTPLIIHKLGIQGFGIWSLALSIQAYFSLADLGLTFSATRYIARNRAVADWVAMNEVIGTSISLYVGVSVLAALAAAAVAVVGPQLFHIPPPSAGEFRVVIALLGLGVVIGLMTVLPVGCVVAAQRVDLFNVWMLVPQVGIAVATAVGVWRGQGLIYLAALQALYALLMGAIGYVLTRRCLPEASLRPRWSRKQLGALVSLAGFTLAISLAGRIVFFSDTLVIGAFISVAAVGGFAIALRMIQLLQASVSPGASVLGTFASEQEALGNVPQLARMWASSSKWALCLVIPVGAAFIFLGPDLVRAWVGPGQAVAAVVLAWLTVGHVVDIAQSGGQGVLMSTGHQRALAVIASLEAVANLALSIALIAPFGVVGVAIGTTIPMLVRGGLVFPVYASRKLGLPLATYARAAVLPALALTAPAVGLILVYRVLPLERGVLSLALVAFGAALLTLATSFRWGLSQPARDAILTLARLRA